MQGNNQVNNSNPHKNRVHQILAHSYVIQFMIFLVSIYLDYLLKLKISTSSLLAPTGFIILAFGSVLILWAQKTTNNLKKVSLDKEAFYHGPYRFTRTPTHFGLFLLMLGFGVMTNALLVILFAIASFIISKVLFLNEQEEILEKKYGTPYIEYKKMVRF